jgi:arginyl-tRNA synthetase
VTPEQLSDSIVHALGVLVDEGALVLSDGVPTAVRVERPKVRDHGDYATNVALQLGKKAGRNPRELAGELAERLSGTDGIALVSVAGPGFVNITVDTQSQGALAADVVRAGVAYGTSDSMHGERVNLEFVSANPTGPVTLASTRWAAVGDALARLMSATGAEVTREYYFNDHGAQIDRFAASLLARAKGREVPSDGYVGQYIDDIAQRVLLEHPEVDTLPEAEAQELLRREGVAQMFAEVQTTLRDFGVVFDVYFHENSLHESGAALRAIERLKRLGMMYEAEGAWWLRTSDFGDDKDRVVVKSDGQPAYISGDLAYYLDKRERGFDRCVILLGADHHGYVGRLMAMCAPSATCPARTSSC